MNLFSIKIGVVLCQVAVLRRSCARTPKLHRKILNSKSCILCWPNILPLPLETLLRLWPWESGGWEESDRVEGDPQIYFPLLSAAWRAHRLLTMQSDFRIALKKEKKGWERLKVSLSPVHKSSIILLPSMSRFWLLILTLATSNLYSGLILAFQRHCIWPYHPLRVVFVVSPRAIIECGCRRSVDRVRQILSNIWDKVFAWWYSTLVLIEWHSMISLLVQKTKP